MPAISKKVLATGYCGQSGHPTKEDIMQSMSDMVGRQQVPFRLQATRTFGTSTHEPPGGQR